jgi:hypothetical protein
MRTDGGVLYTGADGPRPGPDGPRPGAGARVPCLTCRTVRALGPDRPRVEAGPSARAQGRQSSVATPVSRSREGPKCCLGSAG